MIRLMFTFKKYANIAKLLNTLHKQISQVTIQKLMVIFPWLFQIHMRICISAHKSRTLRNNLKIRMT